MRYEERGKYNASSNSNEMSLRTEPTKKNMEIHTFPIDRYYLQYNLKVLTLFGMWNPYKDDRKYWFYNFYSLMVVSTILVMRLIGECHKMWMVRDDLVEVIRPLSDLVSFVMILVKCINLILRRPDITETLDAFNWERSIPCSRRIAVNRNKVLTSAIKNSQIFTNLFIASTIIYTVVLFSTSIDVENATIDSLPMSGTPIKVLFKPFDIWIAILYDCATYTIYIGLFFIHDCLILNIMMHIATQLDILNFRLMNCFTLDVVNKSSKIRGNSYEMNFEHYEFNEDEEFTPNQELIICIQHYNKIYWVVKVLKKILQPFLLPQLMISLLWLSMIGFDLFVTSSIDSDESFGESIYNAVDLIVIVVQIFIYCWPGQSIIACSDRIFTAVYESHWYYGDRKFQTNLMILRSLVRNPMIIQAVGVFDLSALTFKNILVKAYSAIALLRQMYE